MKNTNQNASFEEAKKFIENYFSPMGYNSIRIDNEKKWMIQNEKLATSYIKIEKNDGEVQIEFFNIEAPKNIDNLGLKYSVVIKNVPQQSQPISVSVIIGFLIIVGLIYLIFSSSNNNQISVTDNQKADASADKANFEYEDAIKRYKLVSSFDVPQEDRCKLAGYVLEKAKAQTVDKDAVRVWSAIEYGACSLAQEQ